MPFGRNNTALLGTMIVCACSPNPQVTEPTPSPAVIPSELIASNEAWGNTEGPAVDSSGALYFTSRGTYKGIVRWTQAEGPQEYSAVATWAGPGGLWIDDQDNIYLTATDEREVQMLSPDGNLVTLAEGFESDPGVAKGPNDLTVSRTGTVYFTDPNGYYGESPPGTVYRISTDGHTSVFDDSVVGPNGIVLGPDDQVLYVANNISETVSEVVRWPLAGDGSASGPKEVVATLEPCVADGMAVNTEGDIWLTCYSYGTAYLLDEQTGDVLERIETEQKALTNAVFGRGDDRHALYLTSSDMERVTGYIYRAEVTVPSGR